mgnify:CR=1 FL=1
MVDVDKPMNIVPPTSTGVKRAVLIGINYTGQQGELRGCHNDVKNIKEYLIRAEGFKESDMLILMDDGQHHSPTKKNIEQAFVRITQYSKAGDVVFVHYRYVLIALHDFLWQAAECSQGKRSLTTFSLFWPIVDTVGE